MELFKNITLTELYIYSGLLIAWWFNTNHLKKALQEKNVKDKKIYWVAGILFLIAWPIMIWRDHERAAREIASNLKREERY